MDKTSQAQQAGFKRILKLADKYNKELQIVDGLPAELTDLSGTVNDIDTAAVIQAAPPVGTGTATNVLHELGKIIVKFTKRGRVKANKLKMTNLVKQLSHPYSYYIQGTKTNVINNAKAICQLLDDNKSILGLSPDDINEIKKAIARYDAEQAQPQAAVITKKAQGTDPLEPLFQAGKDTLHNILDLCESYLEDVHPSILDEIQLAAELIIPGATPTEIDFEILADEDGSPIIDAQILDVTTQKVFTFDDIKHLYIIPTHRAGHFHFEITCPGRQKVIFAATIKRRMVNKFTIRLIKS